MEQEKLQQPQPVEKPKLSEMIEKANNSLKEKRDAMKKQDSQRYKKEVVDNEK